MLFLKPDVKKKKRIENSFFTVYLVRLVTHKRLDPSQI